MSLPAETRERIERIAATALAMHFQKPDPLTDFAISDTVHNALIALAEEERREGEKASREIVSEVQYLPKGSIVRENVLRLLGALPNPPPS